jgi:tetratricopeptide (TPR) repeat protein
LDLIDKRLGNKEYPSDYTNEDLSVIVPYKIDLLITTASKYINLTMPKSADKFLGQANQLVNAVESLQTPERMIRILAQMYNVNKIDGDYEEIRRISDKLQSYLKRLPESVDPNITAKIYYTQGSYKLSTGDIQGAEKAYRKALEFSRLSDRKIAINSCLTGVMSTEMCMGRAEDALRTAAERSDTDANLETIFLTNMCEAYLDLGQFERAREALNRIKELADHIDDKWNSEVVCNLLGAECEANAGKYERALECINSLEKYIHFANQRITSKKNWDNFRYLWIKGVISRDGPSRDAREALTLHHEALEDSRSQKDVFQRIMLLMDIILDLLILENQDETKQNVSTYLKEVKHILSDFNFRSPLLEIELKSVESLYDEKLGNMQEAINRALEGKALIEEYANTILSEEYRKSFLNQSRYSQRIEFIYQRINSNNSGLIEKQSELSGKKVYTK